MEPGVHEVSLGVAQGVQLAKDKFAYVTLPNLRKPSGSPMVAWSQCARDVRWQEKKCQLCSLSIKVFALPKDQNEPKIKIFYQ